MVWLCVEAAADVRAAPDTRCCDNRLQQPASATAQGLESLLLRGYCYSDASNCFKRELSPDTITTHHTSSGLYP